MTVYLQPWEAGVFQWYSLIAVDVLCMPSHLRCAQPVTLPSFPGTDCWEYSVHIPFFPVLALHGAQGAAPCLSERSVSSFSAAPEHSTLVLWAACRVNSYMFNSRQNGLLCFKHTMSYQIYYGQCKGRCTVFSVAKRTSFWCMVMPHLVKKLAYENSISICPRFVQMLFVNALESAECCLKYLACEQAGEGQRGRHKAVEDVG